MMSMFCTSRSSLVADTIYVAWIYEKITTIEIDDSFNKSLEQV